jgi:hypothetical protein
MEEIEVSFKCDSDQVLLMTGFYQIICGEDLEVNAVIDNFAWITDILAEAALEVKDICTYGGGSWSTSAEALYKLETELEEERGSE